MDRKAKGTSAERELIHLLWDRGWFSIRAAGSGSTKYPCPDIMAANGLRRLAIECKSSADPRRYITKQQVDELRQFAAMFACEPWIGFRYGADWYFFSLEDLKDTGRNLLVTEELARMKGLSLNQLAGEKLTFSSSALPQSASLPSQS